MSLITEILVSCAATVYLIDYFVVPFVGGFIEGFKRGFEE